MSIIPDNPDHYDIQSLTQEILETAFQCQRCGNCCCEIEPGSNLVIVSPPEVLAIMQATDLLFDEIAEPYPDTIKEGDREYTLAWAIRRQDGRCRFLKNGACSIYHSRPWICRTYPFMLEKGRLTISPCSSLENLKVPMKPEIAEIIASDLLSRQEAEQEEEKRIMDMLTRIIIPPGKLVVIDGEGLRILNG